MLDPSGNVTDRAAAEVVRGFWRAGIRLRADGGRICLTPGDSVTAEMSARLAAHHADVLLLLETLPAPDRCRICGDATGWAEGRMHAHCTACALVAAERIGLLPGVSESTT